MNPGDPASAPAAEAVPMAQVLLLDITLMLAQLGIESIRTSLVDLAPMAFRPAWSVTALGEFNNNPGTQHGDTALPWAASMAAQLGDLHLEHTLVVKLSPGYWGFAWRSDDRHGAVAAVLYRQAREEHDDAHNALVRLVCEVGIRAHEHAEVSAVHPLAWPAVERRRKARAGSASKLKRVLAIAGAAVLLTSTLAVAAMTFGRVATLQADGTRRQSLAESTMTQGLSTALATGDYGEVQAALSSLSSLGYFKGAVVTNARQRVISTAGEVGDARIGDSLLPSVAALAKTHELEQGSVRHGRLLILSADAAGAPNKGLLPLLAAVMACCAAVGAVAVLFALRYWRHRVPKGL